MADNNAIREGTGKITIVRSVELEGGIHIPVFALADAEGNLLGSSSAPLPVSIAEALPTGANIVGKVGIDQTTPGSTDAVWVKSQGHLATVTTTRPNDTTAYAAGAFQAITSFA